MTFKSSHNTTQPSGWVGPQQYIVTTYGIMRSFDKTTGLPDGVLDIDAFNFFGMINLKKFKFTIVAFLIVGSLLV